MRCLCIAFILLFGAGCSFLPVAGEASLRHNAEEAWASRVQKKWSRVYKHCASEYKEKVSMEEFIRRGKLDVKEYKIGEITITPKGDEARVEVLFDATNMGILMKGLTLRETWILENGKWRLNPPEITGSPFGKRKKE